MIRLTPREYQLAALMAECVSTRAMAERLGITQGTVKVYLTRLYRRLPACDKPMVQLALMYARGEFEPPSPGERMKRAAELSEPRRFKRDPTASEAESNERWNQIFKANHPEQPASVVRFSSPLHGI